MGVVHPEYLHIHYVTLSNALTIQQF